MGMVDLEWCIAYGFIWYCTRDNPFERSPSNSCRNQTGRLESMPAELDTSFLRPLHRGPVNVHSQSLYNKLACNDVILSVGGSSQSDYLGSMSKSEFWIPNPLREMHRSHEVDPINWRQYQSLNYRYEHGPLIPYHKEECFKYIQHLHTEFMLLHEAPEGIEQLPVCLVHHIISFRCGYMHWTEVSAY